MVKIGLWNSERIWIDEIELVYSFTDSLHSLTFKIVAAYMMIEALNNKGYNSFAVSIPSPSEFIHIFGIAAPVFVTMFSKVSECVFFFPYIHTYIYLRLVITMITSLWPLISSGGILFSHHIFCDINGHVYSSSSPGWLFIYFFLVIKKKKTWITNTRLIILLWLSCNIPFIYSPMVNWWWQFLFCGHRLWYKCTACVLSGGSLFLKLHNRLCPSWCMVEIAAWRRSVHSPPTVCRTSATTSFFMVTLHISAIFRLCFVLLNQ